MLRFVQNVKVVRYFRLVYGIAALAGAFVLHSCGGAQFVYAQTEANYELRSQVDVQKTLIDRLDANESQLSSQIQALTQKVDDLSNKISVIEGAGSTILAVLGILNILGFIVPVKVARGVGVPND